MTITHPKTGRAVSIHIGRDGYARLAAYVPGDRHWKRADRQIKVSPNQALAALVRGELYIAMDVGAGARSLIHSRELCYMP